jgi:hypothetical protein
MQRRARNAITAALSALALVGAPGVASATPARAAAVLHPPGAPAARSTSDVHGSAYADAGVLARGDAAFYGSPTAGAPLSAPVVGMAATHDGAGYWLIAADGGIFSYGDAHFYGSAGSLPIQAPVVGLAPTADDRGYWTVALDGGIFAYGDAQFYGSMGASVLNQPIVAMTPTPDGKGYWLVASDGGIFSFGDAAFYGSTGLQSIPASVAGMALTPDAQGYWLAGSDGSVFPFGDAVSYGDNTAASPTQPIAGITATPDGKGYWLLEPDAFPTGFSHPGGGGAIVAAAASQVAGNPYQSQGLFCNAYGPCEAWCALFATWAWEAGGVPIPRYAFTGAVYSWAAANTSVYSASQHAAPGDAVLYGTGPWSTATSVHMGIIAQVWPDGAIVTIEGDSGPGAYGRYNVTINGPFLPTHSDVYNGVGVYAIARA